MLLEVHLLKRKKVLPEDVYIALAMQYGWTFEQIANMTPKEKYLALRGPRIKKFATQEEAMKYLGARQSRNSGKS